GPKPNGPRIRGMVSFQVLFVGTGYRKGSPRTQARVKCTTVGPGHKGIPGPASNHVMRPELPNRGTRHRSEEVERTFPDSPDPRGVWTHVQMLVGVRADAGWRPALGRRAREEGEVGRRLERRPRLPDGILRRARRALRGRRLARGRGQRRGQD